MGDSNGNGEKKADDNSGNNEKKVDLVFFLGTNDNPSKVITPIQLRGLNYDKWARAIRTSLQAKRKCGFVEGKVPKPTIPEKLEDRTAVQSILIAWLLNTIEPSLRSTLSYYDDSQSLLTHLKQCFCVVNETCICQLKASLGECKQGKGEEVSTYFGHLSRVWDELMTYVKKSTCKCDGCTCDINQQVIDLSVEDYLRHFLMGLDGVMRQFAQICFLKIRYQILIKHISESYKMRGCSKENLQFIRTVTMSWLLKLQLIREVNLNLWTILKKFVLTATEKDTANAHVFIYMDSPSGGGTILVVVVDQVVAETHPTILEGVAGASIMHLCGPTKPQQVAVAAVVMLDSLMQHHTQVRQQVYQELPRHSGNKFLTL